MNVGTSWPGENSPGLGGGEREEKNIDLSGRIASFGNILNTERSLVGVGVRSDFRNSAVGIRQLRAAWRGVKRATSETEPVASESER